MSLTSPRWNVPFMLLSLTVLLIASCNTGQQSPTSPSPISQLSDVGPVTAEYFVTLADEAPPPPPPGSPAPAPAPPSAPAPTPPGSGPWSPGPPPSAGPGVPVPTPPSTHAHVSVQVNPEPVPHSGQPITDTRSCRDLKHTWFYDQTVRAETAVGITVQGRENFFDGRFVSKTTDKIWLAGGTEVVFRTRWCSGYAKFHYTQTRFKLTDDEGGDFSVSGPWVRLLAP